MIVIYESRSMQFFSTIKNFTRMDLIRGRFKRRFISNKWMILLSFFEYPMMERFDRFDRCIILFRMTGDKKKEMSGDILKV